jgi:ATP-binding cassette subfamily C protein CydC
LARRQLDVTALFHFSCVPLTISLARILLSDAPIALLDEPTEGLDEETAARVIATLCASAGDRALVIATHRTSDAAAMDRVFDLVDGHLVERTA